MASADAILTDLWTWVSGLPDWQAFLLIVVVSTASAFFVNAAGDVLIRRLTRRIPGEVDDIVLETVHPATWVSMLLIGSYLGVTQLSIVDGVFLENLLAGLLTVLTLIWAVTLSRVGRRVSNEVTAGGYTDQQIVPIIQNVWAFLIAGATLFLILSYWNINITPLLASAGVLGIVIGLAARDTIANFFGSLALYVDGTYRVGDYVVLEDGTRGRVQDVSIRSTVIRTRDDILVTVPNSQLNTTALTNESAPRTHRRLKVPVTIAYGIDVDQLEEILLDIADAEDLVRDQPAPRVRLRSFADSGIDVELVCWISRPRLTGRATDSLLREIYRQFHDGGIEIPFPRRDVNLLENAAGDEGVGTEETPTSETGARDGDIH